MTKKDSASVEDVLVHKETKKSLDEQKKKHLFWRWKERSDCIRSNWQKFVTASRRRMFNSLKKKLFCSGRLTGNLGRTMYAYLKNEDVKNQQAAMKKAQSFELEIQIAIEKVHEAVKLHVKICARPWALHMKTNSRIQVPQTFQFRLIFTFFTRPSKCWRWRSRRRKLFSPIIL